MYCAELAKGNEKRFGCSLFEKYGRIFLIEAFGPAEEAGAREGDELLGVNGEYFRKCTTLDEVVAMLAEASRITLLLRRGPSSAASVASAAASAGGGGGCDVGVSASETTSCQ